MSTAQAVVSNYLNLPEAMRQRQQWLLWRFELKEGEAKPRKVPYWLNGKRRLGKQGSDKDRANLAVFEAACARFEHGGYDGIGFAFLPGDGLIGVDIDGAIDPDTGEVAERCAKIIEACASYTELSPSGKGVHIIVHGEAKSIKDNGIGLEVFCGSQFFTCTGNRWHGTPDAVQAISPKVLARLVATIKEARKKASEAARAAKAATAPAPAIAPPPPPPKAKAAAKDESQGENDFRRVNDKALAMLDAWVPTLFPFAVRTDEGGYRIKSKDLGRDLQEDVSVHADGIIDFGVADMGDPHQGRRTAIDLVMEHHGGSPLEAMRWLANLCGVQTSSRKRGKPDLRVVKGGQADAAPADDAPDPAEGAAPGAAEQGGGGDRKLKKSDFDGYTRLLKSFALIYGTDTVWDGERRRILKIATVRLAFGHQAVGMWLANHKRRKLVMPEQVVFEPGQDLPEPFINLFDGFAIEPVPCTEAEVAPMLELLHHLCCESANSDTGVEEVVSWVLRWLALPLQKPGAKLRSALIFHGPQGTGKNLFFDAVRSIFGRYGVMVGQTELEDKFNDWLSAKLMVIGNEVVTRQELYHHKNKLKWIVTEDQIPIRAIQQGVRWESNHANVVFLSNEQQPMALEMDDRRHLVVYTPVGRDDDLYNRVAAFLADGGAAKFFHYLLQVDMGDFHEFTRPLLTEAKAALIELGLKPSERFMAEWIANYLPLPMQVCSAEQLYRAFRRWADQNGERFPPPQAQFTKTAERYVKERVERKPDTGERMEPRLTYKVVTYTTETEGRKSLRVWLPRGTGPRDGMSEGNWAWEAVQSFERPLSRAFRRASLEEPEA